MPVGPVGSSPGKNLHGRATECAQLGQMLVAARSGESRVLVLRGDAGVGKSALLDFAVTSADGMRTLRALGVESEMELAFAALHQLCAPLLDRLTDVPAPQRVALETAFGVRAGAPPDRFLVALAVLSLLSNVSEERPLLCVVDDAHWLDRASAQVLGFVARRLLAESILLVFGARQPVQELLGLPELEVSGLREVDARALLDSVTHTRLDRRIRDRIVAETKGNPLALLELPRGRSMTQMAGGFGLLHASALPDRIEQSFLNRIEELSEESQLLLLVAAAEPVGDPALMWQAAERLGVMPDAAVASGTDGLLSIDERVTFRHPLVRSAVYRAATAEDRRAAHLALAEVTDERLDPDRRAWHLASAADGPDEAVAVELERSAERAQATGGLAAAAAFLQRSLILTADASRRADRALAAAGASLQAGDFDAARRFAEVAERDEQDEFQGARALLLRGQIAFSSGLGGDAAPLLLMAATRLEPFDMKLARETYLMAWGAAIFAGQGEVIVQICDAVRALPPAEVPRPIDLVLDGYARLTASGRAAATPTLQRAATAVAQLPVEDVLRWGWVAAGAGAAVWDHEAMLATYTRQVQIVRDAGALGQLPIHITTLAVTLLGMGDFAGAAALIAEADAAAAATSSPIAPYPALWLEALRGREAEGAALIVSTIDQAGAAGQRHGVTTALWAAAVLYNGLARYEEAASAAREATANTYEPWVSAWALPELIEAAERGGDSALAREALERLTAITAPAGTDWALGIEARSRALVSSGTETDGLYCDAIELLGRTQMRPELARAHLLYGEWLRRQGRRVEARAQLRSAYDMFVSIGMEAFAERARRELMATGETVRKRTAGASASDELTPQELQIALLVRDGLSNPEVGARLFLSPRTVEWHLRKVFAKLSITSRRHLRDALEGSDRAPTPG
ncbi:regulatory LuxR family protein [Kribbella antiqua]|uniref:Regulatory LuxR family protein n=1 Tax=Kribbella antiqua TaxID=2512217 RepID=A0A4R2IDT6_9ACTN|nr:LuxR family transcriptional regulator [Kribbella antiqua]TCO42336.1 regulatory LuxR family protein [Kribbella antiqua]